MIADFRTYNIEGKKIEEFLMNKNGKQNLGVLIFHSYIEQSEFDRKQAHRLADEGYTCFWMDVVV